MGVRFSLPAHERSECAERANQLLGLRGESKAGACCIATARRGRKYLGADSDLVTCDRFSLPAQYYRDTAAEYLTPRVLFVILRVDFGIFPTPTISFLKGAAMLRMRLGIKPMVQMILTVDPPFQSSPSPTVTHDVDEVIRRLEEQFGGQGKPPLTVQNYIEAFSDLFLEFLMKARIDPIVHFFVVEDNRFTATVLVDERESKLIEKWFKIFCESSH